MSLVFKKILASATALASLAFASTITFGQSAESANPLLITFSKFAQTYEGDHDHRQFIRFSVPADTQGSLHVQVFDADTGGAFDEALGRYNTVMDYTLYGADGLALLSRDESGQVVENVSGAAISRAKIGRDKDYDGQWASLFTVEASAGKLVEDRREFFVMVEGMKGNDGNVFDVRISHAADTHAMPKGLQLYTYLPTVRMPEDGMVTELSFTPPAGSTQVLIENFDAAQGDAIFASRFRSLELDASGQDEWARSTVALDERERGQLVSVTLGGGSESPNDASFFVADEENYPVAINLPPKNFAVNQRPVLALAQAPVSCATVEFDARQSFDPDAGATPLTYRWTFENGDVQQGAVVRQDFAEPGKYTALLEIFDGSGHVGNGAQQVFDVVVKAPPVAAFTAPELIAQGAALVLDASGSTGVQLDEFVWTMGNGKKLEAQTALSNYAFPAHGNYEIFLTVREHSAHPCNTASVTKRIAVNGPPVAAAGGNRDLTVGKVSTFDAAGSRDPDGSIVSYTWDFGDGETATGRSVQHTYHRAGDYDVQLSVGDDTGFAENRDADRIVARVRPTPNQRPVALAGGDRQVIAGQAVLFDATASSDADGQIIDTMWDFGDGTGGNRLAIEHTYWQVGTFELSLTLRDNSGQANDTAVDSAQITVIEGENQAPIIDSISEIAATVFTPVRFDASGSDDRDGSIVHYGWDFGDGSTGQGAVTNHAYKLAGTYRAVLTLEDNGLPVAGLSRQEILVTISDEENIAPIADAGQNISAVTGVKIAFDGSGSSDQHGSITAYRWDFGDGHHGFGVSPAHIYQFAGDYQVTLEVTDNDLTKALTSQSSIAVAVALADNQAPVADAGADLDVQIGEIIHFDGASSHDPDGSITAYQWDFGNGQSSAAAQPIFAYHEVGHYQVQLRVRDDHLSSPATAQDILEVEVRARTQAGDDQ